jgi:hypothetical protein
VFFYAMINFLLFLQATGGGTIERDANVQAVLNDHGTVVRTLDDARGREVEGWQVRLFSGHILPFLLLPGLYFVFAPRDDDLLRDEPRLTA